MIASMDRTTLALTDAETARWNALPAALKEGWTTERETGTAYESAVMLKVRAGMARFDSFPALRTVVAKAIAGEKPDVAALKGMPDAVLPELFFTIGAVGVTALIAAMFDHATTDEDVAALAGLTSVRRDILKVNETVTIPPYDVR